MRETINRGCWMLGSFAFVVVCTAALISAIQIWSADDPAPLLYIAGTAFVIAILAAVGWLLTQPKPKRPPSLDAEWGGKEPTWIPLGRPDEVREMTGGGVPTRPVHIVADADIEIRRLTANVRIAFKQGARETTSGAAFAIEDADNGQWRADTAAFLGTPFDLWWADEAGGSRELLGLPIRVRAGERLPLPILRARVVDYDEAGRLFDEYDEAIWRLRIVANTDAGRFSLEVSTILIEDPREYFRRVRE